jgi:hypothetical protein
MEPDEAVLRCMTCGALMEVPAESNVIAQEAFWHRRLFHNELAQLDFVTRLPEERAAGAITISTGKLAADQSQRLAEWDATIASLTAVP